MHSNAERCRHAVTEHVVDTHAAWGSISLLAWLALWRSSSASASAAACACLLLSPLFLWSLSFLCAAASSSLQVSIKSSPPQGHALPHAQTLQRSLLAALTAVPKITTLHQHPSHFSPCDGLRMHSHYCKEGREQSAKDHFPVGDHLMGLSLDSSS